MIGARAASAAGPALRPLRVLYLMHNAAPGGAARSLHGLLRALPTGAVAPTVLAPDGPAIARFLADGIPVLHIPEVAMFQSIAGVPLRGVRLVELARFVWHARHGRAFRDAIRSVRPDIVHLNDRGMLHAGAVAKGFGIPVVMHARCVADRRTGWAHAITVRLMRRLADRVVAIDESVRWSLRELDNCEVIHNPVTPVRVRAARPSLDGRIRVGMLGNLAVHKGVWDLLACVDRLRERRDIVFRIAGGNTRPAAFYHSAAGRIASVLGLAPDLETAARRWVTERGLDDRVQFLGNIDDIDGFLTETDIMVFPSHLNGPGRSVIEAGIAGVPSVVALVDRIEDVVQDEVTGLIVPERDPVALAAAVSRLADDATLRRRLGDAARERYAFQFDPQRIGRQMMNLYEAVLDARTSFSKSASPAANH